METWTNLPDSDSLITLQKEGISSDAPDSTATITESKFSGPSAARSETRLRGLITPPVTDTYTFWVSGTDNVALWISDDDSRFNKRLVAYHLGKTDPEQWDKHPHQESLPISLVGGQSYYLEAQVMDQDGGGHVTVAWRGQEGQYCLAANGSVATQSSTKWNAEASRAIDGNTSGVWSQGELTLTNDEPNSWLKVDFNQARSVDQVKLYNNAKTENQNRLSNFQISLLDDTGAEVTGEDFFTSGGNAGLEFTWDHPSIVNNVHAVKIQLLGQNNAGNGTLSLAEVECSGTSLGYIAGREVISSAYLAALSADPDDTNDNNLSDAWELANGLTTSSHPEALLEYGDPDGDGLSNFQEQSYTGFDPLTAEEVAHGLTRYMWMGIDGASIGNLIYDDRFYDTPNAIDIVPGVDDAQDYKRFGARYRGKIVAPTTGSYRFWISGDAAAELWLADGSIDEPGTTTPMTNRFGKHRIASVNAATPHRDFDYATSQRSEKIDLVAGEEYYLEVLHANETSHTDHVTLAWKTPGSSREIIPPTAFVTTLPELDDEDDDNLPDSWESSNSLSPTDNGLVDIHQGEYGDPDGDTLTNLQEYQYGTDPNDADSDGDGYSDSDEIDFYGSDPLSSNLLAGSTVTLPNLQQFTTASDTWSVGSNGAITSGERRGAITYTFTVTEAGVHEVALDGASESGSLTGTIKTSISFTLDSDSSPFATKTLSSIDGQTATVRAITPWLATGSHTLTIFHDSFDASMQLRIDDLTVTRLGGADLDSDGIPDWVEDDLASANKLIGTPTESRTSPLSIEGRTQQLSSASITSLAPGASQPDAVTLTQSINSRFFADVDLDETGAVTVDASFLGGVITESHSITWISTNLFDSFADNTLHIREGDALLLDAWSGSSPDSLPFTVTLDGTLDGTLLEDENLNTTHTSGQPFVFRFDTAGSYTLVASHNGNTNTVSLVVHAANFGTTYPVMVDSPRTWTPTLLDAEAVVKADNALVFTETTSSPTSIPRNFLVKSSLPADRYVVARIPDNIDGAPSAILARGTI